MKIKMTPYLLAHSQFSGIWPKLSTVVNRLWHLKFWIDLSTRGE